MRAVYYEDFGGEVSVLDVQDPTPTDDGVVIRVLATGLCLSDWHGWKGHDPDIKLPHVPGHELAGVIEAIGKDTQKWKVGDRVTLPFVCGCGSCLQCLSGNQQVCDYQFQPGFTNWGSFAEYTAIDRADGNLVRLPEELSFVSAASLGCRFVTSFRAVIDQGAVRPGEWVAVHGCGGVGLSAVMIAHAAGARVIGIDILEEKLQFARKLGANVTINASKSENIVEEIMEYSGGGVHISIDALGSPETCLNSILSLRKRGKHVQVGLMVADNTQQPVPMDRVVAWELELIGSHGIQAYRYPAIFKMLKSGRVNLEKIVGKTITLDEVVEELPSLNKSTTVGVTIVDRF